jgi:2-polyprenyl-3-methyl-5-hydroxy-6-metoxy-1,4-benzoquinol methylase
MAKTKYNLYKMTDVFGLKSNKDVLNLIMQGCKEVLNVQEAEFKRKLYKIKREKKENVSSNNGGNHRSSGGAGSTGRIYATPTADALVPQWYKTRDPNWLYNHPDYFWEGLACSFETSAPFVAVNLVKEFKYPRYDRHTPIDPLSLEWNIFDWGAGVGLTTLVFAKSFPNSTIYYNEVNKEQIQLFKWLLKRSGLTNIKIIDDIDNLPELDMLVGIEIVEHFQEPMPFLRPLLNKVKQYGLFAHSSYWESEMKMPTLGHFRTYNFDGDIRRVDKNRHIYGGFRKAMDREGWDFLNWDPFQHKPRFYRKK